MQTIKEKILNAVGNEIFEYAEITTDVILFQHEVVDMCVSNYCGRYGKCWTCPPAVDSIEKLKEKYTAYKKAFVFTTKHALEDSYDFEGMQQALVLHIKTREKIRRALDGENYDVLSAGSCNLCDKCTYPDSPCRFPDKAVKSLEACGINVVELAKSCGINYVNGENTVTYFSMILFG